MLDETLRAELQILLTSAAQNVDEIVPEIIDIRERYEDELFITCISGHPKEQKQRLKKLVKGLDSALDALLELPAEYYVAITALGARGIPGRELDSNQIETDMALLALGAQRFLRSFEAPKGRPVQSALENAVRALLRLIRDRLGLEITIRWNKDSGLSPEPSSDGCRAIVAILVSFASPPARTAILNMIDKVKDDPDGEAPSPFDPVVRATFDELDASLWPGREKRT